MPHSLPRLCLAAATLLLLQLPAARPFATPASRGRSRARSTLRAAEAAETPAAPPPPQVPPFLPGLVGADAIPGVSLPLDPSRAYVTLYEIGGPLTRILSFTVSKELPLIPHVGVRVHGREWFYSNRIESEPAEVMDGMLGAMPRATFDLGPATMAPGEVEAWIARVDAEWTPETYDVFDRNCNHFGTLMADAVSEGGLPEPYRQATLDVTEKMLDQLPGWRREMGLHFMTKITRLVVAAWGNATKEGKAARARELEGGGLGEDDEGSDDDSDDDSGGAPRALAAGAPAARRKTTSTQLSATTLSLPDAEAQDEAVLDAMDDAAVMGDAFSADASVAFDSAKSDDSFFAAHVVPVHDQASSMLMPKPVPVPMREDEEKAPKKASIRELKKVADTELNPFASALLAIDATGTVRRRLWTKADFLHLHAVSGTWFLIIGPAWLVYSHIHAYSHPEEIMGTSGPFHVTLLLAGLLNALSAVPMSRFSSDKLLDVEDLKANGFTLGGTGLTCMCLWAAWWFSGAYPDALRPLDTPFFLLWTAVCVLSTANWEYMLQQNFEASGGTRARRSKFGREDVDEMNEKRLLYRLASWPNLTQLAFLSSIPLGGAVWAAGMVEQYPQQMAPMYHYAMASAMGYALSMFGETLRDRKLIDLQTDMKILVAGFVLPMVSVVVDAVTYGDAVTINPLEYWKMFEGVRM